MSTYQSFIYFLREIRPEAPDEELIKVGYSIFVQGRLRQLQSDHQVKLRILATFPGTRSEEQKLHHLFSSARVRGEWFRPCPAIQAVIDAGVLPTLPDLPPRIPVKRKMLNLYAPPDWRVLKTRIKRLTAETDDSMNRFVFDAVRAHVEKLEQTGHKR